MSDHLTSAGSPSAEKVTPASEYAYHTIAPGWVIVRRPNGEFVIISTIMDVHTLVADEKSVAALRELMEN